MNTNAILAALSGIQQNAQAALPVVPNNGNPAGAYNMPPSPVPQQAPAAAAPPAATNNYAWLQPSQSMQMVQDYLKQRANATTSAGAPPQITQAPATTPNVQVPIIPTRAM